METHRLCCPRPSSLEARRSSITCRGAASPASRPPAPPPPPTRRRDRPRCLDHGRPHRRLWPTQAWCSPQCAVPRGGGLASHYSRRRWHHTPRPRGHVLTRSQECALLSSHSSMGRGRLRRRRSGSSAFAPEGVSTTTSPLGTTRPSDRAGAASRVSRRPSATRRRRRSSAAQRSRHASADTRSLTSAKNAPAGDRRRPSARATPPERSRSSALRRRPRVSCAPRRATTSATSSRFSSGSATAPHTSAATSRPGGVR